MLYQSDQKIKVHTCTVVTLLFIITIGFRSSYADDIQQQIDALRNRIESVEDNTIEMRNSLDRLREENEMDWLTEERTEQIKTLVHDVLADADTRSSLVGDGLLGGWDDGFFVASSDGLFRLKVGALVQERYIMSHRDTADKWRGGFENNRTRLHISGHIFNQDLTFLLQPGFGWLDPHAFGSAFVSVQTPVTEIRSRLWDAWVNYKFAEEWSAKLGIFMLPFTRESLVSDQYQLAVDRSVIDYRLGLGRSQGVQFTWARDDIRAFTAITDGSITLGSNSVALNANASSAVSGLAQANQVPPWSAIRNGTRWSVTSRVEFLKAGTWDQFNEFTSAPGSNNATMVGVAIHAQRGITGVGKSVTSDLDLGVTADLSMNFDGGTFFISGTYHNQKSVVTVFNDVTPNVDWVGYVVQGSVYTGSTTEVFLRFEGGGAIQNSYGGDDLHILTTGANWYLDGHGLKITSDFGWNFGDVSAEMTNYMLGWRESVDVEGEWVFRTQLQLAF